MITSVRIPKGAGEASLQASLGSHFSLDEYPPYFGDILTSSEGIRFIFNRDGEFLDEINEWQLVRAQRTPSVDTRKTRSSALMAVLRWYDSNDLSWRHCNELAHMALCRLHYRATPRASPQGAKALVAKSTWNQWMVHWCQFLGFAEQRGWVDEVGYDLADAKERGRSEPIIPILLPADMQLLDASATTQRLRAGLHAMVGTGMRVGEMAGHRRDQAPDPQEFCGLAYRPRTITGKGLKQREIVWPLRAAKSIAFYKRYERALAVDQLRLRVLAGEVAVEETYLTWRAKAVHNYDNLIEKDDAPLWLAENGDPLSPKRWSKDFEAFPSFNGRRVTPHWLRHTYAVVTLSMLIKQQIREELIATKMRSTKRLEYFRDPLDEVRKRLGHASMKTTLVYLDHIAEHRHLLSLAIDDLQNMYIVN